MGCQDETSEEICFRDSVGDYRISDNLKNSDGHSRLLDNDDHHWSEKFNERNGNLPHGGKVKDENSQWFYCGNKLDLTRFQKFHPGGTLPLKNSKGVDLKPSMRSSHHSSEAYYLLRDFYNGNSEEDIVDWSKPMLGQVGSLGSLYTSWVWCPVDRPLRLFQSDILEKLTRTNWKQVIGVWIPVITATLIISILNAPAHHNLGMRVVYVTSSMVCGMMVWPLLEYSIHRWLFHLQPPKSSAILITIHFGLHGLHHKVPFDEGRLLFPPGPCSVMALALYYIYTSLFPWWVAMAYFSGTMLGYLIYDLIHYYLHHGNPKDGSYLYYMKRYHNQHHFAQQDKGFGISSDFWDNAFDTTIRLKKLFKPLSWE